MVHKSTLVLAGTGRAVVTATGMRTEIGRIGTLAAGVAQERAPLERRLDELGRRLVWLALAIGASIAGIEAANGADIGHVLSTGIALAVAAVPEALPAVATIALAVGVRRMAARHALVRSLPAVEALGSTTTICTDKTRTLTSGVMRAARVWTKRQDLMLEGRHATPDHAGLRAILEAAALSSQPQSDASSTPVGVDGGLRHASSAAFTTLALSQIFHLESARSDEPVLTFARALANRPAVTAVVVTVLVQLSALYVPPLAAILDVVPLGAADWMVVLPLSLMPVAVGQAIRYAMVRRRSLDATAS